MELPVRVSVSTAFASLAGLASLLSGFQTTPDKAAAPVRPANSAGAAGVAQVQDLLESLARFDRNGRSPDQKLGFEIPERAVNEYLAYTLRIRPRPGITAASVTLGGGNEVTLRAEVDLSAIQEWNGQLIPEALRSMIRGKQSGNIILQFEAQNGFLSFTVKDA